MAVSTTFYRGEGMYSFTIQQLQAIKIANCATQQPISELVILGLWHTYFIMDSLFHAWVLLRMSSKWVGVEEALAQILSDGEEDLDGFDYGNESDFEQETTEESPNVSNCDQGELVNNVDNAAVHALIIIIWHPSSMLAWCPRLIGGGGGGGHSGGLGRGLMVVVSMNNPASRRWAMADFTASQFSPNHPTGSKDISPHING